MEFVPESLLGEDAPSSLSIDPAVARFLSLLDEPISTDKLWQQYEHGSEEMKGEVLLQLFTIVFNEELLARCPLSEKNITYFLNLLKHEEQWNHLRTECELALRKQGRSLPRFLTLTPLQKRLLELQKKPPVADTDDAFGKEAKIELARRYLRWKDQHPYEAELFEMKIMLEHPLWDQECMDAIQEGLAELEQQREEGSANG